MGGLVLFLARLTTQTVEEVDGSAELHSLRKDVECKGCIEVSYRWVTNFRERKQKENRKTSQLQEAEQPDEPLPRRQLPLMGAIPEKALKGDVRSHQAV